MKTIKIHYLPNSIVKLRKEEKKYLVEITPINGPKVIQEFGKLLAARLKYEEIISRYFIKLNIKMITN
jgi:hypothetical protein